MRTLSFGRCGSKRSSYSREFELPQCLQTSSSPGEAGPAGGGHEYGAMLPIFLDDLRRNHQQELVEVTLELDGDALVLSNVEPTNASTSNPSGDGVGAAVERSLSITSRIRRKFPWLRSSSSRSLASSSELAIEDPVTTARNARKMKAKLERTRSSAQTALKGLRFINKTTGATDAGDLWRMVEERFKLLAKDGLLARDDFGQCIGMEDSKEFAVGIFDTLARRRQRKVTKITKEELYDFWLQISDQSFDARLQIFFDM